MSVVCPSGKLLNTKEKELFLVLEAGQCISHHTLVPGNHLHSSLTPFQRGCKLLPVQYVHLITGENKLQSNEDSDLWYIHEQKGCSFSLSYTFIFTPS